MYPSTLPLKLTGSWFSTRSYSSPRLNHEQPISSPIPETVRDSMCTLQAQVHQRRRTDFSCSSEIHSNAVNLFVRTPAVPAQWPYSEHSLIAPLPLLPYLLDPLSHFPSTHRKNDPSMSRCPG